VVYAVTLATYTYVRTQHVNSHDIINTFTQGCDLKNRSGDA